MSRFLWGGGGFAALAGSFGRPAVRTWAGIEVRRGACFGARPTVATRSVLPLPPDVDPQSFAAAAEQEMARRATRPGVCVCACAINPGRWEVLQFTRWDGSTPDPLETRYEVLHLCRPELEAIASPKA